MPDPFPAQKSILILFSLFDYFFSIIITAFRTNPVRHSQFVAMWAGRKIGSCELPIRPTPIFA